MILIDYGAGNLASVQRSLVAAGAAVTIARRPDDLAAADAIVIPGVGHFSATAAINDDWRRAIRARLEDGAALLGICLGMQWLFEGSDEAPDIPGAGLLHGRCHRLSGSVKVPHVGWNRLATSARPARLLDNVPHDASVYFTHTFAAPVTHDTSATSHHGSTFAAAVERGRIWGTQFHPEKSGRSGLRMLANFAAFATGRP